jgi:hypothetical protein
MKNSFMRYGVYSGLFVIAFIMLSWVLIKFAGIGYAPTEIIGYTTIILSLSFVYFGIRFYRDKQNGGVLSFWRGLGTGMLIVLVPSVCFGLVDVVYITLINPHFYDNYIQNQEKLMKASMSAAEFAVKAPEMRKQMQFFSQPWADFLIMFFTVAPIGLIATVISSFMLMRKTPKAAIA